MSSKTSSECIGRQAEPTDACSELVSAGCEFAAAVIENRSQSGLAPWTPSACPYNIFFVYISTRAQPTKQAISLAVASAVHAQVIPYPLAPTFVVAESVKWCAEDGCSGRQSRQGHRGCAQEEKERRRTGRLSRASGKLYCYARGNRSAMSVFTC